MLGSLVAVNNPFPFSISGFTGLTTAQIISFFIVFVIFNAYVVLTVIALVAFYFTSKPRHGVVRTAAIWHFIAVLWMLFAFMGTVWGAPAEKTFLAVTGWPRWASVSEPSTSSSAWASRSSPSSAWRSASPAAPPRTAAIREEVLAAV